MTNHPSASYWAHEKRGHTKYKKKQCTSSELYTCSQEQHLHLTMPPSDQTTTTAHTQRRVLALLAHSHRSAINSKHDAQQLHGCPFFILPVY